jgi:hypothetical protein
MDPTQRRTLPEHKFGVGTQGKGDVCLLSPGKAKEERGSLKVPAPPNLIATCWISSGALSSQPSLRFQKIYLPGKTLIIITTL